jgi:hypothetical protein
MAARRISAVTDLNHLSPEYLITAVMTQKLPGLNLKLDGMDRRLSRAVCLAVLLLLNQRRVDSLRRLLNPQRREPQVPEAALPLVS